MNAANNKTDKILKQSSNDSMKTSATENEYNKLGNCQTQIENGGYTENKIKMKQNIIRDLAKVTNTDMKYRAPKKKW